MALAQYDATGKCFASINFSAPREDFHDFQLFFDSRVALSDPTFHSINRQSTR